MPSTYAHYRMGEQVRKMIGEEKARVISRYPQLYRIGLHGPDIFFYYKAFSKNYVHQMGKEYHQMSGKVFFEHVLKVLKEHNRDERYFSYAYGLLNHFALDACCHKFVSDYIEESGVCHTEIETEFDRYLMLLDHMDPLSHPLTRHIAAIRENAEIVAAFYAGVDKDIVLCSLQDMILFHNIFLAPNKLKRKCLYAGMHLTRRYDSLHGFVINEVPNPKCERSNKMLHKYYRKGRKKASLLIDKFGNEDFLTEDLDQFLCYNFEGKFMEFEN